MTSGTAEPGSTGVFRRSVLKGAASIAGVTCGSGAISGFPAIWAQTIRDVVLHHVGPPVTAIPAIAEQATKDLGFQFPGWQPACSRQPWARSSPGRCRSACSPCSPW
jgi:hypothetical protein